MKLLTTAAAVAVFARAGLAALDAGIYTYAISSTPAPSPVPTLSPSDASVVLADELGLSRFYSPETANDTFADLAASMSQKWIFKDAEEVKRKILLIFDGVKDTNDVLPEEEGRRRQIVGLSEVPSMERNKDLVMSIIQALSIHQCTFIGGFEVTGGRVGDEEPGECDSFALLRDEILDAASVIKVLALGLRSEWEGLAAYHINIDFPAHANVYEKAAKAATMLVKQLTSASSLAKQGVIVLVAPGKAGSSEASWNLRPFTLGRLRTHP